MPPGSQLSGPTAFYSPADYLSLTRLASLSARGAFADIQAVMSINRAPTLSSDWPGLARLLGTDEQNTRSVIAELVICLGLFSAVVERDNCDACRNANVTEGCTLWNGLLEKEAGPELSCVTVKMMGREHKCNAEDARIVMATCNACVTLIDQRRTKQQKTREVVQIRVARHRKKVSERKRNAVVTAGEENIVTLHDSSKVSFPTPLSSKNITPLPPKPAKRVKPVTDFEKAIPAELEKFACDVRSLVKAFIALAASVNGTKCISQSRELSLLCQLADVRAATSDVAFRAGLTAALNKQVPNVNYVARAAKTKESNQGSHVQARRSAEAGEGIDQKSEKEKPLGYSINKDSTWHLPDGTPIAAEDVPESVKARVLGKSAETGPVGTLVGQIASHMTMSRPGTNDRRSDA